MEFSASELIRAADGFLGLTLGIAIAFFARRAAEKRVAWGLAAYCLGSAGQILVYALFSPVDAAVAPYSIATYLVAGLVASAGGALLLGRFLGRGAAERAVVAAIVVLPFVASASNLMGDLTRLFVASGGLAPGFEGSFFVAAMARFFGVQLSVAVAFVLALRALDEPAAIARRWMPLSVALVVFPAAFRGATWMFSSPSWLDALTNALHIGGLLAVALAWLGVAWRVGGRMALVGAWAPLVALVVTQLEIAFVRWPAMTVGLFRMTSFILIAVLVLRRDLLGTHLAERSSRRGALAAVALATLFIVAQIAQNFLAAQYGLLMGGIVAGALLFAASPIQRAFERSRPVVLAETSADSATRRRDIYAAAVRVALADHALTRGEERTLAHLAQELGIGAGEALDIRHAVEDEKSKEAA